MAKQFYYQVMGEIYGPMSGVELRDRAMAGDITPDTLVRIDEDGNWVLAARLKNLFDERGRAISHSAILGTTPKPEEKDQQDAAAEATAAAEPATDSADSGMAWPPETAREEEEEGGTAEFPSDGIDFQLDSAEANRIADLPEVPAVYALYGGRGSSVYVAYVGTATDLKTRIDHQLIRHDRGLTTGMSAVALNPDHVTEVRWWMHAALLEPDSLEAAQLVAFDILEPLLANRHSVSERARQLYRDPVFVARMVELIKEGPAGHLAIRTLDDAWERIEDHEQRLANLERRLDQMDSE